MNSFGRPFIAVLAVILAATLVGAADPLVLKQSIKLKGKAGNLDHLAVDVHGERLFVANKPNGTLDIVDLKIGKLVKQIPDQGKASGVAYAADLDTVFVGNEAGTCNAFDGKEYKLRFSTKLADADNVKYRPAAKLLYVAHGATISVLDAKSGKVQKAIALPGDAHGFAIDEKAGKIYVSLTKPSQIGVIELAKNEVVDKFPLTLAQGNSPVALDAVGGRLFVGCRKEPKVVVMDTKSGKELAGVEIPGDIDDLLFDAHSGRIFAICGGGLAVITRSGDKYEVAATIATPKSSRTATISPSGDRLYLGVPSQGGKAAAEIRVYAVAPLTP